MLMNIGLMMLMMMLRYGDGRFSGYMRDDNNDDGDEGDDEDDDGAYRYSGYGGCSESESEWADDRDGWSDR